MAEVSTVVVLVVATGALVAEFDVAGGVLATGGHGADLFVASSSGGEVQVQRWDLDAGRLVWVRLSRVRLSGRARCLRA